MSANKTLAKAKAEAVEKALKGDAKPGHHYVFLSNGQSLLLVEDKNNLSIFTADMDGTIEWFLLEFRVNGVLVAPDSGEAVWNLVQDLKGGGET